MTLKLQTEWLKRISLRKEADRLRSEADHLEEEAEKINVEADKFKNFVKGESLLASADLLRASADIIRAEADSFRAEGDKEWLESVLANYGNIKVVWSWKTVNGECWLENGDSYGEDNEEA